MKRLSDDPVERLAQCRGEATLPPAVGEVEVLAWQYEHDGSLNAPMLSDFKWPACKEPWNETELVDRAHVTRLQAERDSVVVEVEHYSRKIERMQSELTKARELLASTSARLHSAHRNIDRLFELEPHHRVKLLTDALHTIVYAYKCIDNPAHQSAPAAKVQPVAGCADAAWLLFDGRYYDTHGVCVLSPEAIISKAKAYAGYAPAAKGGE